MLRIHQTLVCAAVLAAAACPLLAADPSEFTVWSGGVPGRLYVPETYTPAESYALVIFYHGVGERGTNNTSQVNANIDQLLAECRRRQVFLYAPQSSDGLWSDGEIASVMAKVHEAESTYSIDLECIYVTGLSAGGLGVFNSLEVWGGEIAAGVGVCPLTYGDRARDAALVGKPIWLFHAANDPTVPVSYSRGTINGIRAQDGGKPAVVFPLDTNPTNPYYNTGSPFYSDGTTFYEENGLVYTEYDTGGHAIWERAYQEGWMYGWLFDQSLSGEALNHTPIPNAGPDAVLAWPATQIELHGTVIDDGQPEPPAITVTWSMHSGPGAVTFADPHALDTTAAFSTPGIYVLYLSASDGEKTGTDAIAITVQGLTIVMDNGDSGYAEFGGSWWHGTGGYLNDQAGATNLAAGYATYQFTGLTPGRFYVRTTWVQSGNRNAAVPYTVYDGTIAGTPLGTVHFNQQVAPTGYPYNGFLWPQLSGSFYTIAGSTLTVKIAVVSGAGYSMADGVMIERVCLLGDFNDDGTVTHGDYTIWADNFGRLLADVRAEQPGWFPLGSYAAGATAVTHGLYTTWADHFGETLSLTVGEASMPAVASGPDTKAQARAERRAARLRVRQLRRERIRAPSSSSPNNRRL